MHDKKPCFLDLLYHERGEKGNSDVRNAELDREIAKEKAEHPELSKATIKKVASDHIMLKGSAEAKAHMKKLRAARVKKVKK